MPPGKVDVRMTQHFVTLNALPYSHLTTVRHFRVNGADHTSNAQAFEFGSVLFAGGELELACENAHWELLIEVASEKATDLVAEHLDGATPAIADVRFQKDASIRTLAGLSIEHLRSGTPDRLYTEGLAIAIMARALMQSDDRAKPVSARGTDTRIARAIDYAEAHLNADLSIAELARVAAMSPSWFRECFHAATGQSVHAYVRDRRLERARLLLAERHLSIDRIAGACGFADQSHLTRTFKRHFGTTPGQVRRER